ncbi:MAG: nitrophenyl compound nitroreductase subunit ArsF family protein [Ferruginibacter sp.]
MKQRFITSITAIFTLLFIACNTEAQTNIQQTNAIAAKIEVIQFHSEHRCVTCVKIEKLTRATLASYFRNVPFKLVNVDDKQNKKSAEQFQATGTALFLYNPATGKKKELTNFAFLTAGNETKFDTDLKKFIEEFIKNNNGLVN